YGIMMLYKRKNADLGSIDRRVDSIALYAGTLAPFLAFALTHPEAKRMLGLPAEQPQWVPAVVHGCWAVFAGAVALWIGRQLDIMRRGIHPNIPKLLLLGAVLVLTATVFSPFMVQRIDLLMVLVVLTSFHNVQYHAIVWFYQRNRFRLSKESFANTRKEF